MIYCADGVMVICIFDIFLIVTVRRVGAVAARMASSN